MFEFIGPALDNLLSPAILFFGLGILAAAVRSDLEIPPVVGKAIALYLMVSIGFKGGVALSKTESWGAQDLGLAVVGITLSFLMPWLAYALLRGTTKLSTPNAAAVAATYGSVSVVTFVTAAAFLTAQGIEYAGHLVAVLALMETPAIISGLVLARRTGAKGALLPWPVLREALVSGSVFVLLGSLAIGWMTGARGMQSVGLVLVTPFQGVLAIFLLEMGLIVVRRLREARPTGVPLVAFGIYMPLVGAALGLAAAKGLGLSVGDGMLLAVLAASASYIAVPAALRHALPDAEPGIYVSMALAITFPFNILVGIPLYHEAAKWVLGG
jgi:uncharacterized protein